MTKDKSVPPRKRNLYCRIGFCKQCNHIIHEHGSYLPQFCSMECRGKWRSKHFSGENSPSYKGKIHCICKQCEKSFTEYPSRIADGRGVFCSKHCFNQWKRENTDGTKFSWYKGGPLTVKCSWCGNELLRKINEVESRENFFCNSKCQSEWRKIYETGENSHHYLGGGEYHFTFTRAVEKEPIYKFYKYTCMICGKVHTLDDIKPDVHHIDPREKSIPVDKLQSGLIVLCHSCHTSLKSKSNFEYWTEYFSMLIKLSGGWDTIYIHIKNNHT